MPAKLTAVVIPQCAYVGCHGRADYEVHDSRGTYMGSYCSDHAHDRRDALDAYDERLAALGRESSSGQ